MRLPNAIEKFLNHSDEVNQILGVNLALGMGFSLKYIALYILNTNKGWCKIDVPVVSRDRRLMVYNKTFLGETIRLKLKMMIEPTSTELDIRLNKNYRGFIVFQHRNIKPVFNAKAGLSIVDGLVQLMEENSIAKKQQT